MKRYAKFGYAAPFRFRVILEKPQGGGQNDPPPTRAILKYVAIDKMVHRLTLRSLVAASFTLLPDHTTDLVGFIFSRSPPLRSSPLGANRAIDNRQISQPEWI